MEVVVGKTRTGKTLGCVEDLADDPRRKLWLDPQDSLSRVAAKRCRTGIYDRIKSTTAIPFVGIFEGNGSGLDKMQSDQVAKEMFKTALYGKRNIDPLERPLIEENTDVLARAFQYQKKAIPCYWMSEALDPWSGAYEYVKDHCTDAKTRWDFGSWQYLSKTQQRMELGPVKRIVESTFGDASVIARCGDVDLARVIYQVNNVFVEGEGASENAIYTVLLHFIYAGIEFVKRYREPLLVIVDEAANYGLPGRGFLTNDVLQAIATLEKYGLEFVFIMQSIHALDAQVRAYLLDNARRITCYAVGSPETAKIMADVMGTRMIDPDKIAGTEKTLRQLNDGFDQDGKPLYYRFEEERKRYRSIGDQLKLTEKGLMGLAVGERYVCEGRQVWREQLPMPQDPLPWGLSERHLLKILEGGNPWSRRAEYVPPPALSPGKHATRKSKNG